METDVEYPILGWSLCGFKRVGHPGAVLIWWSSNPPSPPLEPESSCGWGVRISQMNKFVLPTSTKQEKGCFAAGFGVFCVCTYPPKGLSKEQGLGVVLWAKWDPIWANWDPSGQFESGKKCSRIGGGEFNHRCQEVLDLAKWLIGC